MSARPAWLGRARRGVVGAFLCASIEAAAAPPGRAEDDGAGKENVLVARLQGSNTRMQRLADELTAALVARLGDTDRFQRLGPVDLDELPRQQRPDPFADPPEPPRPAPCQAEDGACLAQIVPQRGARWLVIGHLVGGGELQRMDVQLLRLPGGALAWRNGTLDAEATTLEVGLASVLDAVLRDQGYAVRAVEGVSALVVAHPPTPLGARTIGWIVAGAGGAAAVAGAVMWVSPAQSLLRLRSPEWRAAQFPADILGETRVFNKNAMEATVVLAAGAFVLCAGLLTVFLSPREGPPPATVAVTVGAGWAGVVARGTW